MSVLVLKNAINLFFKYVSGDFCPGRQNGLMKDGSAAGDQGHGWWDNVLSIPVMNKHPSRPWLLSPQRHVHPQSIFFFFLNYMKIWWTKDELLIFSQVQNTSTAEWKLPCSTKEWILSSLISSRVNTDFECDTAGEEAGPYIQIHSGTFFSQVFCALTREMQQSKAQKTTEYLPQRTNAQSSVGKARAFHSVKGVFDQKLPTETQGSKR